jgi:hypothetical protein
MRKIFIRIGLAGAAWFGTFVASASPALSQEVAQASQVERTTDDPQFLRLVTELGEIGQHLQGRNDPATIASYNLQQADVIEQILQRTKGADRVSWLTQLVDCLHVAALHSTGGDVRAYRRLLDLEQQLAQVMPGSPLAAYATHCEMQAEHTVALNQPNADFIKTQEHWRKRLASFVQSYPSAKETPEDLMELAMVSESLNRNTDAKRCYGFLAENFPSYSQAARARGAISRLELEGKTLKLALPLLYTEDSRYDVPFDIDELRGKVTVVYFWSSRESQSQEDLAALKVLMGQYHARGAELLCVNLDNTPQEARRFLHGAHSPGVDVFQRGGLDGTTALRLGLVMLPTTFVVGKDGRVLARDVQIVSLDKQIARHLADPVPTDVVKPAAYLGQHWPWTR